MQLRHGTSVRAGVAVLVTALVVGCTPTPKPSLSPGPSGAPTTSASAGPDGSPTGPVVVGRMAACELVFDAEVANSLGVSIETSEVTERTDADGVGWLSECVYWRHVSQDTAPLDLTLGIGDTYVAQFEALRTSRDTSPRDGLGDAAFFRVSTVPGLDGPVGAVFVRIGNAVLGLSLGITDVTEAGDLVLAGDEAEQVHILSELAALAVQRLTEPPVASARTCELLSLAAVNAVVETTLSTATDVDKHDDWGPACQYGKGDEFSELVVALLSGPEALAHFDACRAGGETALGVGDEAIIGYGDCTVRAGLSFTATPLMARSGDTIVTVGIRDGGLLDGPEWRATLAAVARLALAALGSGPGSTPAPVGDAALTHPCSLVSNAEVTAVIGWEIVDNDEVQAYPNRQGARCSFMTASFDVAVELRLGVGDIALGDFNIEKVASNFGYTPVDGLGDEALMLTEERYGDQSLVYVMIRSGDAILELRMGLVSAPPDFVDLVAPGSPDEQLDMLRELFGLIQPRLRR